MGKLTEVAEAKSTKTGCRANCQMCPLKKQEIFDGSVRLLKARLVLGNLLLTVITLCAIAPMLSLTAVARTNLKSALQQAPGAPQCDVKGDTEISITCDYSPAPNGAAQIAGPRIAVNHASFFFDTGQDSHMKIGLTITNRGPDAIAEARIVYIAIDGADGKNYLRRPLPHVDLSKIAPEQTIAYSETLLSPAFPRGTYTIHLWIPSSEPSLKFDPAHNLLLNNIGVADSVTGLNTLATFTVLASSGHKKHPH